MREFVWRVRKPAANRMGTRVARSPVPLRPTSFPDRVRKTKPPSSSDSVVMAYYKWDGSNDQIWTATVGNVHTQITSAAFEADNPILSPNGLLVVYRRSTGTRFGPSGIAVCDYDGANYSQVFTASSAPLKSVYSVCWNADNDTILFSYDQGTLTAGSIQTIKKDGTGQTSLYAPAAGGLKRPVYNYDSTLIAFLEYNAGAGGNFDIVVMNADGTGRTTIKSNAVPSGIDEAVSWAYASNKIAYLNQSDNSIRIINSDGTGDTTISSAGTWFWISRSSWHPDDSNVVGGKLNAGQYDLYNCATDGSGVTQFSPTVSSTYSTSGIPFVLGSRVYFKKRSGGVDTYVSTNLSGGDSRTEDTPAVDIGIEGQV